MLQTIDLVVHHCICGGLQYNDAKSLKVNALLTYTVILVMLNASAML